MRPRLGAILLAGAVLLPAAVRLLWFPGYPGSDDAFIHYSLATNVAAGRGWGVQAGEPVNMSSSPLFTLVAAGLVRLGGDPWRSGAALTLLAACAGVWWTWWAARRLGLDGLSAAWLAATNLHLWRWSGALLETSLAWAVVPLAIGLAASAGARGERRFAVWAGIGAVLGAATLLRFELALLLVVLVPGGRASARARWLGTAAGLALLWLPWALFALGSFGTLVPTTLLAKAGTRLHWPSPAVLESLARVVASAAPGAAVLLALGFAMRARRGLAEVAGWAVRHAVLWIPPCGVALFYAVTMDILQSPGRYFLPFTPLLALLAVAALPAPGERRRLLEPIVAVVLLAQAGFALSVTHHRVAPVLRGMEAGYVAAMRGVALELAARCRAGDEVLVWTDIGVLSAVGVGQCRILDGGGLATPELIGRSAAEIVDLRHPRFVVESLGEPGQPPLGAAAPPLVELWSRQFPSHGIARPDRRFVVRLLAPGAPDVGGGGQPG